MGRSGRVAVFLQARIGSTRLPSKALFTLAGKTAVGSAMQRLKRIPADCHVLLTDSRSIVSLEKETLKYGFDIMEGPADDVLKRFASAVRRYNVETLIRATGDNPLVFFRQAEFILNDHVKKNADHSWLTGMPLGAGVEIVKAEKLLEADSNSADPYEREHVTPYIYNRPGLFALNHLKAGAEALYPDGRITMDTMNDYLYLKRLFEENQAAEMSTEELIKWLRDNPHPDNKIYNAL